MKQFNVSLISTSHRLPPKIQKEITTNPAKILQTCNTCNSAFVWHCYTKQAYERLN